MEAAVLGHGCGDSMLGRGLMEIERWGRGYPQLTLSLAFPVLPHIPTSNAAPFPPHPARAPVSCPCPGLCALVPAARAAVRQHLLRPRGRRLGRRLRVCRAAAAPALVPGRVGCGGSDQDLHGAGHPPGRGLGGAEGDAPLCGVPEDPGAWPAQDLPPRAARGEGAGESVEPRCMHRTAAAAGWVVRQGPLLLLPPHVQAGAPVALPDSRLMPGCDPLCSMHACPSLDAHPLCLAAADSTVHMHAHTPPTCIHCMSLPCPCAGHGRCPGPAVKDDGL